MTAVRVAGGVTLAAGALVLAGALATAQRRRIQQAVILKALGATRARILRAISSSMPVGWPRSGPAWPLCLGSLAAWIAVTQVMDLPFEFSWTAVAQALGVRSGSGRRARRHRHVTGAERPGRSIFAGGIANLRRIINPQVCYRLSYSIVALPSCIRTLSRRRVLESDVICGHIL